MFASYITVFHTFCCVLYLIMPCTLKLILHSTIFFISRAKYGQHYSNKDTWMRPREVAPGIKIPMIVKRPMQAKIKKFIEEVTKVYILTTSAKVSWGEFRMKGKCLQHKTSLCLDQIPLSCGLFLLQGRLKWSC